MKKHLIVVTILSAMAGTHLAYAADDKMEAKPDREKCYGVAKAQKNDCAAKDGAHSCAGQSKTNSDPASWVYVPKGLCDKLAGGTQG